MKHSRRPVVVVEDHVAHIDEVLDLLDRQWPELLLRMTVVCLDKSGGDTQLAVDRWKCTYPELQVFAVDPTDPEQPSVFEEPSAYIDKVRGLLAPRGVLVQDVQLETLSFVPKNRCWESVDLAAAVRGKYPSERVPHCAVMSNKQIFPASFGKERAEDGFDVLNKNELEETLVPLLARRLRDAFELEIERSDRTHTEWLTRDAEDADRIDAELDLVLWEDRSARLVLAGRAVEAGRDKLSPHGQEPDTWRALVDAHLSGAPGIPTHVLGARVAPTGTQRATQIQAAARLIGRMRERLRDGRADLPNINHCYCLANELRVGRVRLRPIP